MNRSKLSKLFLALSIVLVVSLLLTTATNVSAQKLVLSVSDPVGDDRGPGYYGYPTADVFKPGVFDLTKLEVYVNDTHVIFKVYVKDLGGNPWNGPNGFCLQYVQIYIRTTETGLPARMDTIGLNIVLRPDYAWYYALLLAPGWEEQPVPVGQRAALYYANGTVIAQGTGFSVYADTASNAIVAVVSRKLLSDIDNIPSWRIVVAMASYDGFGPMRVRPVSATGGEWVINGSAYATADQVKKLAKAIAKNLDPRVMDLLVYSPDYKNGITAEQQYEWLNSYDPDKGLPAMIPGLAPTILTTTATQTILSTLTTTKTQTIEKTLTTTSVSISSTTISKEIPVTDWTMTSIVGVVLLIIGFVIGFFVRRK